MTTTELLEKDQEFLRQQMVKDPSPLGCRTAVSNELDRIVYAYNEACEDETVQQLSVSLIQTVKGCLSFLDTFGQASVWETKTDGTSGSGSRAGKKGDRKAEKAARKNKASRFMALVGVLSVLFAYVWIIVPESGRGNVWTGILFAAGGVLLFLSGLWWRKEAKSESQQKVEIQLDPGKVVESLRTVTLIMDHLLMEASSGRRWEEQSQAREKARAMDSATIDLYAGLLEAYCSQDGSYALQALSGLKYYLHQQKIEAVDYTKDTENYFDLIPGQAKGTIRPALLMEGEVLKRGLASV